MCINVYRYIMVQVYINNIIYVIIRVYINTHFPFPFDTLQTQFVKKLKERRDTNGIFWLVPQPTKGECHPSGHTQEERHPPVPLGDPATPGDTPSPQHKKIH